MSTETHTRKTSRRYAAARAESDANPNRKRAARVNRVTIRTAQRWVNPQDAQGSPLEVYARGTEDIERLEVFEKVSREQTRLKDLTTQQLVAEIHALHAENAKSEGADNAARVTRGISLNERALIAERDATVDAKLAARYREAAARGLSEADVFDQWSPR